MIKKKKRENDYIPETSGGEERPLLKDICRQWDASNENERKKYGFDLYENKLFNKTNFMT